MVAEVDLHRPGQDEFDRCLSWDPMREEASRWDIATVALRVGPRALELQALGPCHGEGGLDSDSGLTAGSGPLVPVSWAFWCIRASMESRQNLETRLEEVTFPEARPVPVVTALNQEQLRDRPMTGTATPIPDGVTDTQPAGLGMMLPPQPAQAAEVTGASRDTPPSAPGELEAVRKFVDLCRRPLPEPVLLFSPPRRETKRTDRSLLPRRSKRLAQKSWGRSSNPVVAAQNVLMRKLGMLEGKAEPNAEAVRQFAALCAGGLSDSNAKAIEELFPDHIPAEEDVDEALQEWA